MSKFDPLYPRFRTHGFPFQQMTPAQVAQVTELPRHVIREAIRSGALPSREVIMKVTQVSADDVQTWFNTTYRQPAVDAAARPVDVVDDPDAVTAPAVVTKPSDVVLDPSRVYGGKQ